jgi:class 3 adenylate cyclase/tetratricopeptide (TPR) repeat protein
MYLNLLASYSPRVVHRRLMRTPDMIQCPETETFHSAVALADISGFTRLTERMASAGPEGVERLTVALNKFFKKLVDTVQAHGGDIVKFAGDAVLVHWPGNRAGLRTNVLMACQCALNLQQALHNFDADGHRLTLHTGIAAGEVHGLSVGGEGGHVEYIICGQPLAEIATCLNEAAAGEVYVSPRTYVLAADYIACSKPKHKSNYKLNKLVVPLALPRRDHLPLRTDMTESLQFFVAPALREKLDAALEGGLAGGKVDYVAELRSISVVFCHPQLMVRAATVHDDVKTIQRAFSSAQKTVIRFGGSMRQLIIDDKGCVMIAVWGVPPESHEDDPARATEAALALVAGLDALGVEATCGVTTGEAFCGDVGSTERREYAVVGDVVNLSARLMASAKEGVLVDEATYNLTESLFSYQTLPKVSLKGKSSPVSVFRPLLSRRGGGSSIGSSLRNIRRSSAGSSQRDLEDSPFSLTSSSEFPIDKAATASIVANALEYLKRNLSVSDKKWMGKTYPNSFVGRDAVTALVEGGMAESRHNAVLIGRMIEKDGHLQHVMGLFPFSDAFLFFQFTEPPSTPTTSARSSQPNTPGSRIGGRSRSNTPRSGDEGAIPPPTAAAEGSHSGRADGSPVGGEGSSVSPSLSRGSAVSSVSRNASARYAERRISARHTSSSSSSFTSIVSTTPTIPLVGRTDEMIQFTKYAEWLAAKKSVKQPSMSPRAVIVMGEAGVGTSRLLLSYREVVAKHIKNSKVKARQNAVLLCGEGSPTNASEPYGVLTAALDAFIESHGSVIADALALGKWFESLERSGGMDGGASGSNILLSSAASSASSGVQTDGAEAHSGEEGGGGVRSKDAAHVDFEAAAAFFTAELSKVSREDVPNDVAGSPAVPSSTASPKAPKTATGLPAVREKALAYAAACMAVAVCGATPDIVVQCLDLIMRPGACFFLDDAHLLDSATWKVVLLAFRTLRKVLFVLGMRPMMEDGTDASWRVPFEYRALLSMQNNSARDDKAGDGDGMPSSPRLIASSPALTSAIATPGGGTVTLPASGGDRVLQIRLRPFEKETETHELVSHMLGLGTPTALSDEIHRRAQGNPFVVLEMSQSLVSTKGTRFDKVQSSGSKLMRRSSAGVGATGSQFAGLGGGTAASLLQSSEITSVKLGVSSSSAPTSAASSSGSNAAPSASSGPSPRKAEILADALDFVRNAMPRNVSALITSKVDRLSPSVQRLLKCASVVGTSFDLATVFAILPASARTRFTEDLGAARRAGLVSMMPVPDLDSSGRPHWNPEKSRSGSEGEKGSVHLPPPNASLQPDCTFANARTRDVVYSLMLFSQRRELHGLIALEIVRRAAVEWFAFPSISFHAMKAEQGRLALKYARKAGDVAFYSQAGREACDQYDRADAIAEKLWAARVAKAAHKGKSAGGEGGSGSNLGIACVEGELDDVVTDHNALLVSDAVRVTFGPLTLLHVVSLKRKRARAQHDLGLFKGAALSLRSALSLVGLELPALSVQWRSWEWQKQRVRLAKLDRKKKDAIRADPHLAREVVMCLSLLARIAYFECRHQASKMFVSLALELIEGVSSGGGASSAAEPSGVSEEGAESDSREDGPKKAGEVLSSAVSGLLVPSLNFVGGMMGKDNGAATLPQSARSASSSDSLRALVLSSAVLAEAGGSTTEAIKFGLDGIRLARGLRLREEEARLRQALGMVESGAANWTAAQEHLRCAIDLAEELGEKRLLEECSVLMAKVAFFRGDLRGAVVETEKALESARARGDVLSLMSALLSQAQNQYFLGDNAQCASLLEEVSTALQTGETPDASTAVQHKALLALVSLQARELKKAYDLVSSLIKDLDKCEPTTFFTSTAYLGAVEVLVKLLHLDKDDEEEVSKFAKRQSLVNDLGSALSTLYEFDQLFAISQPRSLLWKGVHFALRGKDAKADAKFAEARDKALELGMDFDAAVARFYQGRYSRNTLDSGNFTKDAFHEFQQLGVAFNGQL